MLGIVAITLAASLLGSAAQTTVGFGAALFLSPVMFLILGAEEAVLCTLAVVSWLSVLMLVAERDRLALDRGVSLGLILPAIPGVLIGAVALGVVDKAYLQILVGLVVVVVVVMQVRGMRTGPGAERPRFVVRPSAIPAGLISGALNGAVSTGGPPLAIWLRSVGSSPSQLRHTLAVAFIAINVTSIAVIGTIDSPRLDEEWLWAFLGGLAGIPAGHWLGSRALRRVDERTFGRAVAAALALVGATSMISGLGGL